MTVREAFAKAGHPVPEDAMIGYSNITGAWRWGANDAHGTFFRGWAIANGPSAITPNLANLPARDAYDALPECVRKVLDEVACG